MNVEETKRNRQYSIIGSLENNSSTFLYHLSLQKTAEDQTLIHKQPFKWKSDRVTLFSRILQQLHATLRIKSKLYIAHRHSMLQSWFIPSSSLLLCSPCLHDLTQSPLLVLYTPPLFWTFMPMDLVCLPRSFFSWILIPLRCQPHSWPFWSRSH